MASMPSSPTKTETSSILSKIWDDNIPGQLDTKTIWSVSDDDPILNSRTPRNGGKKTTSGSIGVKFPGPPMFQEVAKGGRLYLDEVFKQLEELETERRSNAGDLGLKVTSFTALNRGQFDWDGLSAMLGEAREHFNYFKEFVKTVEGMRVEAESVAISVSPMERTALIFELVMNKKDKAESIRQSFDKLLQNLYATWESKMSAIQRILCPSDPKLLGNQKENVKLDVMPYLLKELAEVIRVSRIALFTVRKRYDEVCKRVTRKIELTQAACSFAG